MTNISKFNGVDTKSIEEAQSVYFAAVTAYEAAREEHSSATSAAVAAAERAERAGDRADELEALVDFTKEEAVDAYKLALDRAE